MREMKVHYRNIRLFINAGMEFPECSADAKFLDLDRGTLPTTSNKDEVTCRTCLNRLRKIRTIPVREIL